VEQRLVISNLPDWITAGTAVTAVMGGLFGVYTTTQSRIDVAEERMANAVLILESLSKEQYKNSGEVVLLKEKMARNEVSAEYLKEGQDRLHDNMSLLAGEVRALNQTIIAKHK
jgi:hypothetical protein